MTNDRAAQPQSPAKAGERGTPRAGGAFPIVGVGASAGGLEAYTELLKHLPLDTGMAFVLVQHLDPQHESALTQLLSRATSLPVQDVTNNLRVEANHIYVIPPNTSLAIAQGVLKLQPRGHARTAHHSIDSFFESLAQDQHERAIGVILSGTATDGTLGLEAIKAEDGITFAQDDSARYDSMPRNAVAAGCVDFVLSPEHIAQELARIAKHPYIAGQPHELLTPEDDRASATEHEDDDTALPSGGHGTPGTGAKAARAEAAPGAEKRVGPNSAQDGFRRILLLMRNHSGVDFSLYKSATIQRRIARRMVLERKNTLDSYADYLRGNTKELDALWSDVLISVTSFFRNPEAFDVLGRKIFPKLLRQSGDDPLRVWTLGCSTGQEAYSIAMAFVEAAEKTPRMRKLQVFATDLNDALLDKARHGLYARSLAQDLSPERLRRFFVEEEGGYRINKALREMVVFARQNLIIDPPFSRMDLISCRNLLIYLEPHLQKKLIPTFHYALKPEGFLFLGASESVGTFTDLFEPADKKNKIYSRKAAPTPPFHLPASKARGGEPSARQRPSSLFSSRQDEASEGLSSELNAQREADRVTVNLFAPPGVVINADLQILQFRGPTGAYLESATGKASFDVLKMARDGLMLPLRAAINKAKKDNKAVRKESVRVLQDGSVRTVNVDVIPLKNVRERCFLILFEDAERLGRPGAGASSRDAPTPRGANPGTRAVAGRPTAKQESRRIAELEADLAETRDYLQSIQEQHEAANEELQAANEEVQSANEELQSVNEELETSKEEMESANEELTTVNEEMSNRNAELGRLNSDLVNLQTSTHLAIVLLGRDLTIRRFSAQAEKQFNLVASDIGRPIRNVRHNLVLAEAAAVVGSPGDSPGGASRAPRARAPRGSARGGSPGTRKAPVPPMLSAPDLESFIGEVITSAREHEREVRDHDGRWHSLRVRPYFTLDNKVDGAVLVLVDIDALKRSEHAIATARDFAEAIIRTTRDPLVILSADLHVESANEAFYRTFRISPAESVGRRIYDLGNRQWDIPPLHTLLEDVLPGTSSFDDYPVTHDFEGIGRRSMLLNARTVDGTTGQPARILLGIQDITDLLQSQASARESGEKFKLLFERSPLPKWAFDLETLRFVDVNEAAVRRYGYRREEFLRMRVLDVCTPETGDAMQAALVPLPHRLPESEVCQHRKKSGEIIDVEVHGNAIELAGKRVWLTTINDITERKRVEEALHEAGERFRFLAETIPQKIFTARPNGDVDYFNPQWLQFTGVTFEELRNWGWEEFIHPDDLPENIRIWRQSIATGEPFSIEHRIRRADGMYRWHLSRAVAFKGAGNEVLMWVGSNTDIHEVKEVERRKDEFLAMLGHELRGPLAPLSNMLQIVKRQGGDDELLRRAGSTMERQLGHMTRLIDDLLDVSRISRGKLVLRHEHVDLVSIIRQVVESWRPTIEGAGQELTLEIPAQPLYLQADPVRLAQVFGNLVSNACKYTEPGGRIALSVEPQGNDVVVSLKDTGIGIPPDMLLSVFEMFTQVDRSLERARGGLGIGLTLVAQLIEMHGGSVQAFSKGPGNGSEFVVRLPGLLKDAQPRADVPGDGAQPPGAPTPATPRRILVVDDNRDSSDSLALVLTMAGHETHTAYDGLEAVAAAASFRPDVVLLDIGLPKLSGYDVCRRLREEPWGKRMVLVALTGWGQAEDRKKSSDAGFNGHLVKPVDYAALTRLLEGAPSA